MTRNQGGVGGWECVASSRFPPAQRQQGTKRRLPEGAFLAFHPRNRQSAGGEAKRRRSLRLETRARRPQEEVPCFFVPSRTRGNG